MERRYRDTKIYIRYLENTDRYICIVSFSDTKEYDTFHSEKAAIDWAENYIDIVKGNFTYQVGRLKSEWKKLMREVEKSFRGVLKWLNG